MSTFGIGKLGRVGAGAAGATAVIVLVAGCGSSSSSSKSASTNAQPSAPAGSSSNGLASKKTSIGTVLVDSSGRTVYELVGDSASNPNCTGSCLSIWPEVKVNGTQVVVNGHPAFTFAADSAAGDTKGQNVKDQWGLWLALDPSGNPISAGGSSSKAPNGGGAAF